MSSFTITAPNGAKVRTTKKQRYLAVRFDFNVHGTERAAIVCGSSTLEVVQKRLAKLRSGAAYAKIGPGYRIWDAFDDVWVWNSTIGAYA